MQQGTAGHSLISHIVFNKFPAVVKKEFIHQLSNNYPSITDILDNYHKVLNTLSRTCSVRPKTNKTFTKSASRFKESNEKKSTVLNYKTTFSKKKCKLCSSDEHSLGLCSTFTSYEDKLARLRELTLCTRCAGSGHTENNCFGKQGKLRYECRICQTREHITPLCPASDKATPDKPKTNVSLCLAQRSVDACQMLPTMTLTLQNGKRIRQVRCLIDFGSQRSYITESAAKDLCPDVNDLYALKQDVNAYIGEETRDFKQMSTGIKLHDGLVFVPLLVDKNMDVRFEVPGMNAVIEKFKRNNIKLLDNHFYEEGNHEIFVLDMLLGIDVISCFSSAYLDKRLGGNCLVMHDKVSPIGSVIMHLSPDQQKWLMRLITNKNRQSEQTKTSVNAIMDPIKSYFNPLEHILENTEVDNGLEHLFSLESIGIKSSDDELVSIDNEQIRKFENGITFEDGHYNVELPWYTDKIDSVPSNHFVALKVLDRTLDHLKRKGLVEKYQAVFDQQLADGIIEEIEVKPEQYNEKIWIPHRPVIKVEEQVTTKIRPVFNCSLKTHREVPSLNEAAYPGVDLIGSILKLHFSFFQFTFFFQLLFSFKFN